MNQFTNLELEYIYYAIIVASYKEKTRKLLPRKLQNVQIDFAYENDINKDEIEKIVNSIKNKVGTYLE
jgi:transcriptional regulator NrdR family protein